jgi:hypothetical protein
MSRLALAALVPALALAGCLGPQVAPQVAATTSYQNGYNDGCATSKARSKVYSQTVVRNETSYAQDSLYKQGWNVGYRACGSSATRADPTAEQRADWHTKGPLD